jgi:hypothetical protein
MNLRPLRDQLRIIVGFAELEPRFYKLRIERMNHVLYQYFPAISSAWRPVVTSRMMSNTECSLQFFVFVMKCTNKRQSSL